MGHEAIDGVVVRVRDMGENGRYLSVLTAEKGRITILAKGFRSVKGPQTGVSQLYSYGNFEYYRRGSLYILKGGSVLDAFYSFCYNLDRVNLASYIADVICEVTDEGEEASGMLRLLLNSFYAISKDLYPQDIIKGAFEFRAAADSGYEPELDVCSVCGRAHAENWYLDVMNGAVLCADCLARRGKTVRTPASYDDIREADILCPISDAVRAAIRYCIRAPLGRIFAFDLKDEADRFAFAKAAQTYLLSHLGRGFDSLDFYNTMRAPSGDAKGT